jgi:pyrimidine-nucleoside phosphorylase
MLDLIERKKRGTPLGEGELDVICRGVVDGTIPDYQLAAWLMAVWFRGMTAEETLAFTRSLVATGEVLDWTGIDRPVVDKHSTGGVGDKTSLVLVPLVAAAGLAFAKMSGRGLGHTGGTLDKLESIPGFNVTLTPRQLRTQVERIGCALVGQSPELVPADGLLYALRDVSGTIDSVPLIAGSVMSKKLAAGAGSIVLDVKYGAGAFMNDIGEARILARAMVDIGRGAGRQMRGVLSSMDQPLGRTVGNALEVREAIETLRGDGPADLWELALELGVQLLLLAGVGDDREAMTNRLVEVRDSGAALRRFQELVEAQGGDPRVADDPGRLPSAPVVIPVEAARRGRIATLDARAVADVVLRLGGARRVKGESIDPAVGVRLLHTVGEKVTEGQRLAEIHAASEAAAREVEGRLRDAFRIAEGDEKSLTPKGLEIVD